MQNLFWKPAWTSDGNCHGIPNPWNCFQAFQSPQRSFCKLFFAHFCESLLFQCSSISWKPFNCFTPCLHECCWYYSEGYLTKKPFHSISLSAESHFKVFWVSFWGMLLYFLRTASHFVLWNFVFCTDVLCITLVVKVLRKISHHVSCFGHYETYFGYIPQCRKTFSWYSYACLDFTVVFTQLINVLRLPLVWAFWGVFILFCTMFL